MAKSYAPYGNVAQAAGSAQSSYGFTGEFTDPSGMLYLRARYYAPSMGRFLTRDTWAGDANQPMSFNRWAYVDENPVNRTDPSGMCVDPDGTVHLFKKPWGWTLPCETSATSTPVPTFTPAVNAIIASATCTPSPTSTMMPTFTPTQTPFPQPPLTADGDEISKLYSYYADHPNGAWNSNGGSFTVADFTAWILMIESKGDITLLHYNMEVFSRQLWGTGYDSQEKLSHSPYCPNRPCVNGVFNFIGAYSQSGPGRYKALQAKNYEAVEQLPTNYQKYLNAGDTIQSIGNDVVVNPKWTEYNNDLPTQTGNYIPGVYGPPWVTHMCNDTQMFTNAKDGIVYKFKGENGVFVVVYTINQAAYWSSRNSGMCSK